jgi:hypothetical protein
MSGQRHAESESLPNGLGGAALLAAGIGAIALAGLAITADHIQSFRTMMIFYKPTGPLSGVTTSAIVIWLAIWAILSLRWRERSVSLERVARIALILLALALVLTFPPIVDLF